jgi:hypothetical protein
MTFTEALTGSPLLYPIALDPKKDMIALIRLTEPEYAAASFLDGRLLTPATPTAPVPWADVRAAAAGLPLRCHFIFHISHVGSTLMSRLVGQHPALFSLREPAVLRLVADAHRTLATPECPWSREEFDERLGGFLALWSRTFCPNQTAVIKATSFVSEMAADLLARAPSARAVAMTVRPDVFLKALLGGAMSDVSSGATTRLARLARRLGSIPWNLADLSPGECVAMTWLCETMALAAAAKRFPGRVLWVDFDEFLAAPADRLAAVLTHFGATDATTAAQMILAGPTINQYAKAPGQRFDAEFRRRLLDQAGHEHATEVDRGLTWLDRVAADQAVRRVIELANAGGRGPC